MVQEVLDSSLLEQGLKTIKPDEPVWMLNLLRYRKSATYKDSDPEPIKSLPPCSGKEAFRGRYGAFFAAVAGPEYGVEVTFLGEMAANLAGPEEHWDDCGLIKYPRYDAFLKLLNSEVYAEKAQPHRVAALEDWRLFALQNREADKA